MIFTKETLPFQLSELFQQYPELTIISQENDKVIISGNILVYMKNDDFSLRKVYGIDIVIPLNSDELPFVVDKDNYISKSYHHYYNSGKLCLETDSGIRLRFADGFNLSVWMKEYVETYFFSYEYYMRFNHFPFGERSHGLEGILQTYSDIFKTKKRSETISIMAYISNNTYRGHCDCPCGSKRKLRNCHGRSIFPFITNSRKKEIIKRDYGLYYKEV